MSYLFGNNSFASAYPREEQIYLEQEWIIDDSTGAFLNEKVQTKGILISGKEIETIEFYKN